MSTIKVVNVQLGQSATAANNFTLAVPSNPNGTVKLSRGNAGATTSDVLSIDASGILTLPTTLNIRGIGVNEQANLKYFALDFLNSAGALAGNIYYDHSTNRLHFGTDNGTWRAFVSNAGMNVNGALYASGNVTAFSDIKLKTDIVNINDALSKVMELNGVLFTRKDSGERCTGVIAQEVQKVLPEAVVEVDGTLSVAYGNLVGLLIEAIKELKSEVETLRSESKK